jgi:pentatricopeptide repeat protein
VPIWSGTSIRATLSKTYWLVRNGHVSEALRLFDDMVAKGVALDSGVFAL